MRRIGIICLGMATLFAVLILPGLANAATAPAPAPVAASQGFAPIGNTLNLTSPAGNLTATVQKVDTGAVAPVGAVVPGSNGMVVGPGNTVVTPGQLTAMRHGKHVAILTAATLYQVAVSGKECAGGGCWVWQQTVGPVDYWGYGATIWHGWVNGTYWPQDNLYNCANHSGLGWQIAVGYCLWQGNDPTTTSEDIAVGFHANFQFSFGLYSVFHWIYIGIGNLGWTVSYG